MSCSIGGVGKYGLDLRPQIYSGRAKVKSHETTSVDGSKTAKLP